MCSPQPIPLWGRDIVKTQPQGYSAVFVSLICYLSACVRVFDWGQGELNAHTEQSSKQWSGWSANCIRIKSGGVVRGCKCVYFCFECNRWTIRKKKCCFLYTLPLFIYSQACSMSHLLSRGRRGQLWKVCLQETQQILHSKAFKFSTENNIWHWKQRTEKSKKEHWPWNTIGKSFSLELK